MIAPLRRSFLLTAFLSASTQAQLAPWEDGELILRSVVSASSATQAIYRVNPETGTGLPLLQGFAWGGWAGSMAFDPYRDGLLCNMAKEGDVYTQVRLYVADYDGTLTEVPGFYKKRLRALCPIGDGRVYFQIDQPSGPHWIQYLDANNQTHTLLDATGAPLERAIDHLIYHEPSNSLIATASAAWLPEPCTLNQSSLFRIPLDAAGAQASGPVQCASIDAYSNIKSLDYLPDGDLLLAHEGGQFLNETLWRVDPLSLQQTLWASPGPPDIDGVVWSERAGQAILLDDTNDVLRLYSEGDSGWGPHLTSNVPVSPSTVGYSPVETLVEVNLPPPPCAGSALTYGSGTPGTGGFVPEIWLEGCPAVPGSISIEVDHFLGGSPGSLIWASGAVDVPYLGGSLYAFPILSIQSMDLSGPLGTPGAGSVSYPLTLTNPNFIGVQFWLQAAAIDPGSPHLVTLTNGLAVAIG